MNNSQEMVSIVTVTLNNCSRLEETLNSIVSQSYSNKELIVIDGGSTDGTLDLLRRPVSVLMNSTSEPDSGIYDAMNKGVRMTSVNSRYTIFMNAGDTFCNSHVISDVMTNAQSNACHLYGDIMRDGRRVESCKKINYYKLSTNMVCHQAFFFLTQSLRSHPYDIRYKLCADYKLLLELVRAGDRFEYLDTAVAAYDGTGVSTQRRDLLRSEKEEIRNQYPRLKFWHVVKTRARFMKR